MFMQVIFVNTQEFLSVKSIRISEKNLSKLSKFNQVEFHFTKCKKICKNFKIRKDNTRFSNNTVKEFKNFKGVWKCSEQIRRSYNRISNGMEIIYKILFERECRMRDFE